jgi:hypothetical protein
MPHQRHAQLAIGCLGIALTRVEGALSLIKQHSPLDYARII